MKILVVRPDRLGDLVLSLPAWRLVQSRAEAKGHSSVLMVHQQQKQLLGLLDPAADYLLWNPEEVRTLRGIWAAVQRIRRFQFDAALVLQGGFLLALVLWLAGIPRRVGPFSKWFSWLLWSSGLRQSRSQAQQHEAEYGIDLAQFALEQWSLPPVVVTRQDSRSIGDLRLIAGTAVQRRVEEWLRQRVEPGEPWVVLHPGMGGSALNWPWSHYVALVAGLVKRGGSVVLTGGPEETQLIERLREEAQSHCENEGPLQVSGRGRGRVFLFRGAEFSQESQDPQKSGDHVPSLEALIALQSKAPLVVAPSTGPLHTAVGAGAQTLSFFPPLRVQSAKRWGPFGLSLEQRRLGHVVLSPAVECPEIFRCAGKKCEFYFCMERVTVDSALEAIVKRWGGARYEAE